MTRKYKYSDVLPARTNSLGPLGWGIVLVVLILMAFGAIEILGFDTAVYRLSNFWNEGSAGAAMAETFLEDLLRKLRR